MLIVVRQRSLQLLFPCAAEVRRPLRRGAAYILTTMAMTEL
jgi:hypothetical protein